MNMLQKEWRVAMDFCQCGPEKSRIGFWAPQILEHPPPQGPAGKTLAWTRFLTYFLVCARR